MRLGGLLPFGGGGCQKFVEEGREQVGLQGGGASLAAFVVVGDKPIVGKERRGGGRRRRRRLGLYEVTSLSSACWPRKCQAAVQDGKGRYVGDH